MKKGGIRHRIPPFHLFDKNVFPRRRASVSLLSGFNPPIVEPPSRYCRGRVLLYVCARPLTQANGLTIIDLFHYGWNDEHVQFYSSRHGYAVFLQQAFPNMLGNISSINTINDKRLWTILSIPLVDSKEKLNRR